MQQETEGEKNTENCIDYGDTLDFYFILSTLGNH